jgi:uncharacterized membrane protein
MINLITGCPFDSFRYGVLYPFVSHLLFGMTGGLLGAVVILAYHPKIVPVLVLVALVTFIFLRLSLLKESKD